jgi:dihydroorotase
MRLLIRNGRAIDPSTKMDQVIDIFVDDHRICEIGRDLSVTADLVIDASGLIVMPGLIDMHVHLREPGREDEETIASGVRAAVKGGFTSIAAMPNTTPVADNKSIIQYVKEKARECGLANVYLIGAITKGQAGDEIVEFAELVRAGAIAFSDDGRSVMNAEIMRTALEYSKMFDSPMILHEEDANLASDGVMHKGYMSTTLGLKGMPVEAEEVMVARDIVLTEGLGAKIHIAHISSAGSVRLVREAKARGVNISCEVTPHHISLADEALASFNTNMKMNPPLRSKDHVRALIEGLRDGTIDVIATDHAPHTDEEKATDFVSAPFGVIGLETALSVVLTELVHKRGFNLGLVVEKMSTNPARILGLTSKGSLQVGCDGDITIVDPNELVRVDSKDFVSLSRNTPFQDWELKGSVVYTIVGGKVVYSK